MAEGQEIPQEQGQQGAPTQDPRMCRYLKGPCIQAACRSWRVEIVNQMLPNKQVAQIHMAGCIDDLIFMALGGIGQQLHQPVEAQSSPLMGFAIPKDFNLHKPSG